MLTSGVLQHFVVVFQAQPILKYTYNNYYTLYFRQTQRPLKGVMNSVKYQLSSSLTLRGGTGMPLCVRGRSWPDWHFRLRWWMASWKKKINKPFAKGNTSWSHVGSHLNPSMSITNLHVRMLEWAEDALSCQVLRLPLSNACDFNFKRKHDFTKIRSD